MEPSPTELHDSAESVARSFLAALDEGRWNNAIDLIHPQTREDFKSWWVAQLQREHHALPQTDVETAFVSPAYLLGTDDPAEAAGLPAGELLTRFAEAVQPDNLHRYFMRDSQGSAGEPISVTRTILDTAPGASGRMFVRYRAEWWHGRIRNEATVGIHVLELAWVNDGWRVRNAELGGGTGRIVPASQE